MFTHMHGSILELAIFTELNGDTNAKDMRSDLLRLDHAMYVFFGMIFCNIHVCARMHM